MPAIKYIHSEKPSHKADKNYYTAKELANLLKIDMQTLTRYRRGGTAPESIKVGYRSYRYPKTSVDQYMAERAILPSIIQPITFTQPNPGRPRKVPPADQQSVPQ